MINRRKNIMKILNKSNKPISGEKLGEKLNVTRQVIVQDIALLRAEGENIIATNRGYLIPERESGIFKKIVSQHATAREMEDELNIIVDHGGSIKDVIIDHPIYGEIRGVLELNNRKDIEDFIKQARKHDAEPLSKLTDGVHMHTIQVENEAMYKDIVNALENKNYLTK